MDMPAGYPTLVLLRDNEYRSGETVLRIKYSFNFVVEVHVV